MRAVKDPRVFVVHFEQMAIRVFEIARNTPIGAGGGLDERTARVNRSG